jgi:hypothetical protein
MTKELLDFDELNEEDKRWFLKETWCDKCDKADLGMKDPVLYVDDGKTFIEGKCLVCNEPVVSQIITKQVDG